MLHELLLPLVPPLAPARCNTAASRHLQRDAHVEDYLPSLALLNLAPMLLPILMV